VLNTYIVSDFDKLARLVERQTNVSEPVPPYWLRALVTVETALAATKEKDPKKKINASNSRALNGMKQKVKKAMKDQETLLTTYNEVRINLFRDRFSLIMVVLQDPDKFERDYIQALAPPPVAPRESRPAQPGGAEAAQDGEPDEFTTVGKGGKGVQHTVETIFKDLAQVNENRGKKVCLLGLRV
jgi:translation initiation factor 3 subunit C